jgi:predicted Zn-dependent protease
MRSTLLSLLFLPLTLLLTWTFVPAQSHDNPPLNTTEGMQRLRDQQQNPHVLVYARASALQDYQSAIYALHHLLLDDPENSFLQDSLAYMYARTGNIPSCLAWCDLCLEKRPNSLFILNLSANLLESANMDKEALARFETLHQNTGSNFYRYKISSLQFELGRYGESLVNIESMLQDSSTSPELIMVTWDDVSREVPMRAALLNLRGNLELQVNQEGKARKSFRQALKIAPEFALPRNNIRALDEKNRQRNERGSDR